VVRTRRFPAGETYHFRTYASAGGLYPIELYVACADLPGLSAGLYHFHALELALRPLRAVDVRGALSAAADEADLAEAAAVLVLSGILSGGFGPGPQIGLTSVYRSVYSLPYGQDPDEVSDRRIYACPW
jgi:hypothetical protein